METIQESIKAHFFGRKPILQDLVQGVLAPSQPLDFSLGQKLEQNRGILSTNARPVHDALLAAIARHID